MPEQEAPPIIESLIPPTLDAREWVERFEKEHPTAMDPDTMIGWFANALMRGYDEGMKAGTWEDEGSIDPKQYTELELTVAGALSTMPPFANQYSPRALPFARIALEAVSSWEPADS